MNTKELLAALKEIEPHVEGPVVQDDYLEVRIQDGKDDAVTYPLGKVTARALTFPDGKVRYLVVLNPTV